MGCILVRFKWEEEELLLDDSYINLGDDDVNSFQVETKRKSCSRSRPSSIASALIIINIMNNSFIHYNDYPPIYKISLDNCHELLELYTEILKDVPVDEVHDKFTNYVSSIIQPVDWKGIWRTTIKFETLNDTCPVPKTNVMKCDFKVDVVDVSRSTLQAVVVVRSLLSPAVDSLTTQSFDAIDKFLTTQKIRTVPLIELYVISEGDEEEFLLSTAIVIERTRFFYKYIWRPWDDLSSTELPSGKDIFIENNNRLEARLNLYFDVKNKLLPESTVNKIQHLIEEGRKIRSSLDAINSKELPPNDNFYAMGSSQSSMASSSCDEKEDDGYLDESEVYEMMKLKVKMEGIEREMKLLEDPYLRVFASTMDQDDDEEEETLADELDSTVQNITIMPKADYIKVHVLCKKITPKVMNLVNSKIAELHVGDEDVEILFYKKLNKIFSSNMLKDGDKVYIVPGNYLCHSLPWIDKDVAIEGLTKDPSEVVILSSSFIGDIFVNCNSNAISISNLTIKTSSEVQSIVMVHSGSLDLVNCVIDDLTGQSRTTVVSLVKTDVALDNCKFISELPNNGVVRKLGSKLVIDGSEMEIKEEAPDQVTSQNNFVPCEEKILNVFNQPNLTMA